MTFSKFLPATFVATAALLSGLTVASAQPLPTPAPMQLEIGADDPLVKADFRKKHGKRGHRRGHHMMRQMMDKVDANGDRAITQAEVDAFRAATVSKADASGDGDISLDEFQTIYLDLTRERMVDAFQKLDADGDGVVTKAELDKRFGNIVERMDRNGDGQLDRDDRGGRHGKKGGKKGGKHHGDHDMKRDHDKRGDNDKRGDRDADRRDNERRDNDRD